MVISLMGDIVNIKRSGDDDLFELFQQSCTEVPTDVDEKVQLAASRAIGNTHSTGYPPSLKTLCVLIAGVCLLGVALVRGVTTRWNSAVDSAAMYSVQAQKQNSTIDLQAGILNNSDSQSTLKLGAAMPQNAYPTSGKNTGSENSWRRSKGAWAEYISRLERDPFYQYVQQEKKRFTAQYPDAATVE